MNDLLKELGRRISDDSQKEGVYIPPLLAAYTARCITLENDSKFPLEKTATLTRDQQQELIIIRRYKIYLLDNVCNIMTAWSYPRAAEG